MVQEHNRPSAMVWGHAGANYDFISFGLSDGLAHAVQMLWPRAGERILDIGTGTGWTARFASAQGADVTGIDIAEPLLEAGRTLSAHMANAPDFVHGDAEELPFKASTFDGIVSTYGVMFASRPERAAREMARVTRPGGRLVLMTWLDDPDGYIARFFDVVGRFSDAPPPETSPMVWGRPDWVQSLLGDAFEIVCTPHETTLYAPDAESVWRKYVKGFGPVSFTAAQLSQDGLRQFEEAFAELHAPYDTGEGLKIVRKALAIRGRRR